MKKILRVHLTIALLTLISNIWGSTDAPITDAAANAQLQSIVNQAETERRVANQAFINTVLYQRQKDIIKLQKQIETLRVFT